MRKQRENNWIAVFGTILKILSWVTLACRFKSGPGHQLSNISNTYLCFGGRSNLDTKRQKSTSSDASMMWVIRG
jgi:hypothetical protein